MQQLEFTTSAANSQPQQISTNVTVKALTNTSVKSENGGATNIQQQQTTSTTNNSSHNNNQSRTKSPSPSDNDNLGHLIQCKQEPENDFADLEQCAAALEKDAAANGHFPGLSDLIGDDTNDESFKELISDLTDFPGLFEEKPLMDIKTENDNKNDLLDNIVIKSGSPMSQYPPQNFNDDMKQRVQYNQNNGPNAGGINEMIPAAQKLKHMAEQHQHKNAMGMNFVRPPQPQINNSRSPYREFSQFGPTDFMGNAQNQMGGFPKGGNAGNFPSPDMIKQEILYSPQNDFDIKRMGQMGQNQKLPPNYKQQYSPYGSPMSNHGSPGQNYMPQRPGGPGGQNANAPPPRPSSGSGGANNQGPATLQMKQTQQLHITQHGVQGGHGIQVGVFFLYIFIFLLFFLCLYLWCTS